MKKTIFIALAFAAILSSCNSNEDVASKTVAVSTTTSNSIAAYIAQNYPDTKVISTVETGSTVVATLNTGETVSFSSKGTMISYSNNFVAGLKADSIKVGNDSTRSDSINGHHHGGHKPNGGHSGSASDSTHVGSSSGGHGHDRHFKNEISVDSLSASINIYISTNYGGYSVIHAEVDTICQGVVTEVMVCSTVNEPVKLVFNALGTYLLKAERSLYTDVPTTVSAAVTAGYSTYTVMKRAEKFTLADGTIQYNVFMELNKVRKSVTFGADGTIVCEK
jgi:hypothetical protein